MSTVAVADDPLGVYVGAALGEAHVRSEELRSGETTPYTFGHSSVGWKVFVGARPLSVLGIELAYSDFGSVNLPPPCCTAFFNADSNQDAATAFGIAYLPLPVPYLDIYGKLGVARLHTQSQVATQPASCPAGSTCGVYSVTQSQSSTDLAYGAGAQAKFGSLAVRIEYERINASGGNPDLFALGLSWTF
jgi:hypothetical protein